MITCKTWAKVSSYPKVSLFVLYLLFTLIVYRNTFEAGLVFDFNGWAGVYSEHGFLDIIHSFGYPGLHQIEHFFFYSMYTVFGFNGMAWYISFGVLHSTTAVLVFFFIRALLNYVRKSNGNEKIALVSSFLFLSSPLAADVVVSKVCVHYYTSIIGILLALMFYLRYIASQERVSLAYSLLAFVFALFSLEIAYMLPLAVLFLAVYSVVFQCKEWKRFLMPVLAYFVVLALFLLLHRLVVGSFIGHYGAEVHSAFHFDELMANFSYYFNNYLLFFDFWPYQWKVIQMEFVRNYWYGFVGIIVVLMIAAYVFHQSMQRVFGEIILFIGLFALALTPILNLYCVTLQPIENDRYGYLASVFIYALLAVVFVAPRKKWLYPFFIIYLFFHFKFLNHNVEAFAEMGQVSRGLIDDFDWNPEGRVIILVQPENNNGARAFATLVDHGSEFAESLYLERGIDIRDQVELIYEMNISSVHDSVIVQAVNENTLNLRIGQWGSWFWKYHLGAQSFETPDYAVKRIDDGQFEIEFKTPIQNEDLILYMHGDQWKTFNFYKGSKL